MRGQYGHSLIGAPAPMPSTAEHPSLAMDLLKLGVLAGGAFVGLGLWWNAIGPITRRPTRTRAPLPRARSL